MTAIRVLVLGTSLFAQEIADVAADCDGVTVEGFVENLDRSKCEETLGGLPVRWIDDVPSAEDVRVVCGLGTTQRVAFTRQAEEAGLRFATIVHPTAHVSPTATVGEGSIVGAGVVVGSHTTLGRHVILNRGVLIGHHTEIRDHVSVQAGANVAGSCIVGRRTFVGMGALVLDHVDVGELSVVGAGAVVTRDVPDRVQVMGIPARVVKEGVDGK
jgi:acetyltransferase EpsM